MHSFTKWLIMLTAFAVVHHIAFTMCMSHLCNTCYVAQNKLQSCRLQAAADRAAAVLMCEEDFWDLLQTQEPPLTPRSAWPPLKRQASNHSHTIEKETLCC